MCASWVSLYAVNYAALLAVIAVLAFAFPPLVRLAAAHGLRQASSILAALGGAVLALAWHLIRRRVQAHRDLLARVELMRAATFERPGDPSAFVSRREHLSDLLIKLGRPDEARLAFQDESRALQAGVDSSVVRTRLLGLAGAADSGRGEPEPSKRVAPSDELPRPT